MPMQINQPMPVQPKHRFSRAIRPIRLFPRKNATMTGEKYVAMNNADRIGEAMITKKTLMAGFS